MTLVIDNHASLTWNLAPYLQERGTEVEVVLNDAIGVGQAMSSGARRAIERAGAARFRQ